MVKCCLKTSSSKASKARTAFSILTVDSETADDAAQQWWCITKGGEMVNTAIDATPIYDGDKFELTLKEGY